MYRVLAARVRRARGGVGYLVFSDETRECTWFPKEEWELLKQTVRIQIPGVIREHSYGSPWNAHMGFFDAFCRESFNPVRCDSVFLSTLGLLHDIDDEMWLSPKLTGLLTSPAIAMRYGVRAIVDSDGYLWYLDTRGKDEVRLSDICKGVLSGSIWADAGIDTRFIFDDSLEYVHPYCFIPNGIHPVVTCYSPWRGVLFEDWSIYDKGTLYVPITG